jgi:FKBP-type peptidyl-prolyl cis-trans isomerase 2
VLKISNGEVCMNKKNLRLFTALIGIVAVLSFSAISSSRAEETGKEDAPVVVEGKTVKLNYTLEVDGKVVDSSQGRGPLEFKVGSGQMIPGFEKGVMGMKVGEKKSFKVSPEDGYGPEDPKAIQDIPKSNLSPQIKPEPGMTLYARTPDGRKVRARIIEVKDDVVVINFNHPLAGKTLNFDVEVLEIK